MQDALPKLWPSEQEAASPELRRMAVFGEDMEPFEEVRCIAEPMPSATCSCHALHAQTRRICSFLRAYRLLLAGVNLRILRMVIAMCMLDVLGC